MVSLTIAAKEGGDYLISEGTHTGILVQMVHLGIKLNHKYPDKNGNPVPDNKMILVFETPDEVMESGETAGKPKQISQFINLSLGSEKKPSNMRVIMQAVEGRSFSNEEAAKFDVFKMLGKSVQLNVVHEVKGDKTSHRITQHGISPLHKSIKRESPVAEMLALYLPQYDHEVFKKLPEWIQKMINKDEIPSHLKPVEDF